MTPLRLGLVGCGRLAEVGYIPAVARTPSLCLVAVADPDRSRRDLVADLARPDNGAEVSRYASADELITAAAVDVVVLVSPADAHRADAERAAAAGVPTLVEKPPAPDGAGAAALAALDPAPWVGFNRRFDPGVAAVRRAVPVDGPVELRLEIHYRRASWGAIAVADDALTDLGPHLVDWARWLLGAEVVAVGDVELAHERASLTLDLGGARAHLRAATDRPHHELAELRDRTGTVVARHRHGGLVAGVRGRLRRGPHPLVASLAAQLDALAGAVAGGPAPDLATAADGAACMAVLDAARASAAGRGTAVPIASQE